MGKASMVVVTDKMFTSEQMKLLTIDNVSLLIVNSFISSEVNILSVTTTILALGLYLHSEVQIWVSDALSISSCFQSLLGCLRFSLSSLSISICSERLSLYCFCFFSLISLSISLSAK